LVGFPRYSKAQATAIAGRILEALAAPVLLSDHECQITCSIGISTFPEDGANAEEVIKKADLAMYDAKADGKNAYRFFSSRMEAKHLESLVLEAELRQTFEKRELTLFYQPKFDIKGSITGVEALLRWQHPKMGDIPPNKFIPIAEASGLIIPIGRWVLETACRQNVAWQKAGYAAISVAVNLSPKQFSDDCLVEFIDQVLAQTGHAPHLLQLEITESMIMQNLDQARATMRALNTRHVRLAIDDFGTGYSSLSLMKHFPIDTIKIDRSFVQDLEASAEPGNRLRHHFAWQSGRNDGRS
jgi:predicted signal transduction protein with EAL and GGDEF domain